MVQTLLDHFNNLMANIDYRFFVCLICVCVCVWQFCGQSPEFMYLFICVRHDSAILPYSRKRMQQVEHLEQDQPCNPVLMYSV